MRVLHFFLLGLFALSLASARVAEASNFSAARTTPKAESKQDLSHTPAVPTPDTTDDMAAPDYPEDFSVQKAPSRALEDRYAAFGEDESEGTPMPVHSAPQTPAGLR